MGERDYYLLHINIMKCFESPITTCSPSPIYQRNYSNLILIVVFLEAQLIAWLRLMLATLYGKLIWLIFHGGKWEVWVVVKIMLSAIFIGISYSSSWKCFWNDTRSCWKFFLDFCFYSWYYTKHVSQFPPWKFFNFKNFSFFSWESINFINIWRAQWSK